MFMLIVTNKEDDDMENASAAPAVLTIPKDGNVE
jgi:hypothetical protein